MGCFHANFQCLKDKLFKIHIVWLNSRNDFTAKPHLCFKRYDNIQGPDSRKVSSLKSEILVSNLRFFLDFSQI